MTRSGFRRLRLRRRHAPAGRRHAPAGDPADQPGQVWQALLAPFSLRPPQPAGPGPRPAAGQGDQAG